MAEDKVNPSHYKTRDGSNIEAIDIIEAYGLNFARGCVIKYICRAGHKPEVGYSIAQKELEDLKKVVWYAQREVNRLEKVVENESK